MLKFDPPNLEYELKNTLLQLKNKLNIDTADIQEVNLENDTNDVQYRFIDPTIENFNVHDFPDIVINKNSSCFVTFPRSDALFEISYYDLINVINEAIDAEFIDDVEVWCKHKYFLSVSAISHEIDSIILNELSENNNCIFKINQKYENQDIKCSIITGFTAFGLVITSKENYWDKYWPPYSSGEYYIEIKYSNGTAKETIKNASEAYIFELSCNLGINIQKSNRYPVEYHDVNNEILQFSTDKKTRNLAIGKGLETVLNIYNKSLSTYDYEIKILYLTQVIEYIAPTVIRQNMSNAVYNKLSSQKALNPDIQYINELSDIFNENKINKTDKEAIFDAIKECCDIYELKKLAPKFLTKLYNLKQNSNPQDKNEIIKDFAFSVYATRNSIAHAKANYKSTDRECPPDEYSDFVKILEFVAQQAIRWYHRCPEHLRVI